MKEIKRYLLRPRATGTQNAHSVRSESYLDLQSVSLFLIVTLTSESPCLLDDLIDQLQGVHEFLVVVASDAEAGDQVTVDIIQLCIPVAHGLPGQ